MQDSTPFHHRSSVQRRSISPAQLSQSGLRPPEQSSITGPPPIRRPLTPVLCQAKHKLQPNSGQQTPKNNTSRKSLPSSNRRLRDGSSASSVSSSSSSSSPKNVSSPNDSFHQHRPHLQILPFKPQPANYPGPPLSGHSSSRKSSVMPGQTPIHHTSQHRLFHSTPASNPCSCCTNQTAPSHIPMYTNNTWQGMPAYPTNVHMAANNPSALQGVPHGENYLSPSRPSFGCHMSPTRSPVCNGNIPVHCSPLHGHCVPAANPSRGSEQVATSCQAQCCQVQSSHAACSDTPASASVGILPADAYKMLKDQEHQLKLLQLQVDISHKLSNSSSFLAHI